MKCSDAIMLGHGMKHHTMLSYLGVDDKGELCGCALGGALIAATDTKEIRELIIQMASPNLVWQAEIEAIYAKFPWVAEVRRYPWIVGGHHVFNTTADALISTFFCDVQMKIYTLEQLIDWVRSVEPDCGECNRFGCRCQKAAEGVVPAQEVAALA